ncbi:uncharacterized protein LOC142795860 [Rhipicephalus microplus]
MLSNPFCFLIQVAAVFLGGQHSPIDHASATVTSKEWTCAQVPDRATRADGCIDDVASLPFVTPPAWHRSSTTSCHVDAQALIKSLTPPLFTSGPGSSKPDGMLSNPFCFLIQVAAVFLGGQHSPIDHASATVTSKEWTCAQVPDRATRADGCIDDVASLPFVTPPAWHRSSTTSCHVDAQALIKSLTPPLFTSGPGSSKPDGMLSNPFCFLIQVAAVFLGGQHSPIDHASATVTSKEWTCAQVPDRATRADGCIDDVASLPFVTPPAWHRSSTTSCHVDAQALIKSLTPPLFTSGPGSSKPDGMLSNPFCFLIQVGDCSLAYSYRSDDRFLLLLPCPRFAKHIFMRFSSVIVNLLVCGDIESNPGPSDKDLLAQLLAGQNKISATVENIQANQKKFESKITTLAEKINGIEQQLSSLNKLTTQVNDMEKVISHQSAALASLIEKVDDLENRSRRNNLIIYGLDETSVESSEELEKKVVEGIFLEKLQVPTPAIERIHRLGFKGAKTRPVILKFLNYREKESILRKSYKLKGTSLSLSQDFSKRVREIRKNLWNSATEDRARGGKVKLVHDKLCVDGTFYTWNDERNERCQLNKAPRK